MNDYMNPEQEQEQEGKIINRDAPEGLSDSRKNLVTAWTGRVQEAKGFFDDTFKQMADDQRFAKGEQWPDDYAHDKYVTNITQRHIQQRTAILYAKDPKAVTSRKKRMLNTVWDGTLGQLQEAQQFMAIIQQGVEKGATPDQAMIAQAEQMAAIIEDYNKVQAQNKLIDKIGETLTLLYEYNIKEQSVPFKKQMKAMIRRALTTGVGWVKLGFQRTMKVKPDVEAQISDFSEQLATLEQLSTDLADGEIQEHDAEVEQIRLLKTKLEAEPEIIVREGLTFDFPAASSIIVDTACVTLNGFIGAKWVAQEFILSTSDIQRIYNVDVGAEYTSYEYDSSGKHRENRVVSMIIDKHGSRIQKKTDMACVWEIYNKEDGLVYTVCEGYPDFLEEPEAPEVWTERFWPFFMFATNEADDDEDIYPESDVSLLRDMQTEINRAREGLREHRRANRPTMAVANGALDDDDKGLLAARPANALIELNALAPGQSVEQLLQAVKMPAIDPALYDVNPLFEDIMHTVGTQEANLGGTSGATATESSIAESSRMSAVGSVADDLDEMLTELAHAAGQILLLEVGEEIVKETVGPGAAWPQMSKAQVAQDIALAVEAGSTGKPNKAQEMQNLERGMPFLLQIPGINPEFLGKEIFKRMDDRLDLNDAFKSGMPSVVAQNANQPEAGADGNASAQEGNRGAAPEQQAPELGNQQGTHTVQ